MNKRDFSVVLMAGMVNLAGSSFENAKVQKVARGKPYDLWKA